MGNIQEKPRQDIVIVAIILEIVCVIQALVAFLGLFSTIFAGNNDDTTLYVFQWIMTFLPIVAPIIGFVGALRVLIPLVVVYIVWIILWVIWNLIYIVLLFALVDEPVHNEVITTIFISVHIALAVIGLFFAILLTGMWAQYRSNLE